MIKVVGKHVNGYIIFRKGVDKTEKEWCILYTEKRRWFKKGYRVVPFVCMAHKINSAMKNFKEHLGERNIVGVYVEYKKRER